MGAILESENYEEKRNLGVTGEVGRFFLGKPMDWPSEVAKNNFAP
jgi:hypothetical protein